MDFIETQQGSSLVCVHFWGRCVVRALTLGQWDAFLEENTTPPSHTLGSQVTRPSLLLFSCVWLFATPWTAALQAPPLSPGVGSNSCPLSQWCHPTISSSTTLFSSCPQSFPGRLWLEPLLWLRSWVSTWMATASVRGQDFQTQAVALVNWEGR